MPRRGVVRVNQPQIHLFLIHSPITYWVARSAIQREGLDPAQVLLLVARGFAPADERYRHVPIDYDSIPPSPRRLYQLPRCWRWLRATDRFVADLTGSRSFQLYTASTMERYIQVLRSHHLCAGFSFLEEGLYSYCTRDEMDRTHPRMRIRRWDRAGFLGRIRAARFFDAGHTRAYGIHPAVFPGFEHRVVLEDAIPPASETAVAGIGNVLVFDALSARRRVRLESLLAALRRLLTRLRSEQVTLLHYKFHPVQLGTSEVDAIEQLFREQEPALIARRLPDAFSMEALARARPDARFFVNLSSVGLYAALFGCPVFSFANWVVQAEPDFATYLDLAPRVFRERVRLLE